MPKQPVANPIKPGKLLLLAVALFAATRIFVLVFLAPPMSDVGDVYFDYATRAIDFQQTPYQGELTIEYPPLGWWTIAAPRLANPARITNPHDPLQIGPIYHLYRTTFRSLMFLFDLASFLLLLLVVQKRRPGVDRLGCVDVHTRHRTAWPDVVRPARYRVVDVIYVVGVLLGSFARYSATSWTTVGFRWTKIEFSSLDDRGLRRDWTWDQF